MIVRTTILSLFVLAAMPAFAQPPSELDKEMAALHEYCKADIERLCPKVEPGGGRLKACLMKHKEKLGLSRISRGRPQDVVFHAAPKR